MLSLEKKQKKPRFYLNFWLALPVRCWKGLQKASLQFDQETWNFNRRESFFQVGDSSTLVFVESPFGRLLFPKEALLISDQTHFYSSFILASSSQRKSGKWSCFSFFLSSYWMSGTVCILLFVQSAVCMLLGDLLGLQAEQQACRGGPEQGVNASLEKANPAWSLRWWWCQTGNTSMWELRQPPEGAGCQPDTSDAECHSSGESSPPSSQTRVKECVWPFGFFSEPRSDPRLFSSLASLKDPSRDTRSLEPVAVVPGFKPDPESVTLQVFPLGNTNITFLQLKISPFPYSWWWWTQACGSSRLPLFFLMKFELKMSHNCNILERCTLAVVFDCLSNVPFQVKGHQLHHLRVHAEGASSLP